MQPGRVSKGFKCIDEAASRGRKLGGKVLYTVTICNLNQGFADADQNIKAERLEICLKKKGQSCTN